ncbi:hypothetical protein AB0L82_39295 [Nocardia sp. NPDC052001]|uniref:hypothetical protein n=1 Tax=Nocardia sp. NPDC052001 TaxID=3154853 RepID=UPI00342B040B
MFIADVGAFAAGPGPDGQTLWSAQGPVVSALYPNPVEVNILLGERESVDEELIAEVIRDIDRYLLSGLRFLHAALMADATAFGLDAGASEQFREFDPSTFPVDLPQLNFYADGEWLLRFAEGALPICDPYGVGVTFEATEPVRLEDLRTYC